MDNIKMEDIIDSTSESNEETIEQVESTEQDLLKEELEKVQKKEGRPEIEKATHSLKNTARRIQELGGDPMAILGVTNKAEVESEDDEDRPLTMKDLKKIKQEEASQTALSLADDIESETEKELVKHHLQNTIRSTGNPTEDLNLARAIVNAAKNKQIIEEVTRKPEVKSHSSATSAPLKHEDQTTFTTEETVFMTKFGLSKEDILKARERKAQQ